MKWSGTSRESINNDSAQGDRNMGADMRTGNSGDMGKIKVTPDKIETLVVSVARHQIANDEHCNSSEAFDKRINVGCAQPRELIKPLIFDIDLAKEVSSHELAKLD